jgi:hypothetical protein
VVERVRIALQCTLKRWAHTRSCHAAIVPTAPQLTMRACS